VKRDEWIKNTKDEIIGQTIKIVNLKNKLAPPGRVGMIDAYIADGRGFRAGDYDLAKDVVSAAMAYGVIEQRGAHFYFGVHNWNGKAEMNAAVKEDKKVQAQIRRKVLACAAEPMTPSASEPEERSRGRATKSVKKAGTRRSEEVEGPATPRERVGKQASRSTQSTRPRRVQDGLERKQADHSQSNRSTTTGVQRRRAGSKSSPPRKTGR
jgi:hypothetical protein